MGIGELFELEKTGNIFPEQEKSFDFIKIKKEDTFADFTLAIMNKICPICGTELIQVEDWILCPKNSQEVPVCDAPYHIAKNLKTGKGWMETK